MAGIALCLVWYLIVLHSFSLIFENLYNEPRLQASYSSPGFLDPNLKRNVAKGPENEVGKLSFTGQRGIMKKSILKYNTDNNI